MVHKNILVKEMTEKRYVRVAVFKPLAVEVDKFVSEKKRGYRSRQEYINEAVRRMNEQQRNEVMV